MANLEEIELFNKFLNSKIPIVKKYEFKCALIDNRHKAGTFYTTCDAMLFIDRAFTWSDTISGYYYWTGVNMAWINELDMFNANSNYVDNSDAKCISIW